ncbi:hypothetical protein MKK88_15030 [Methylobacterium sp. E-005]|uniref:hypothetical protein n=1 Tax=Methylobacterium sp. E-005 TaxID=2836549 RepID=UPI001FB973CC|nr:hypothetical protein [Methylobacterium sp. E-005]MCJ2087288.1 hypothetical protein [Methylobacterium sp. E-005]
MSTHINRRALAAGLLAATAAPAVAHIVPVRNAFRGDDTARLPDHAALWARLPLPFSLAEAWHLLSPATQAEIGAAVIGMVLAEYVSGDMHGDADRFHDEALRSDAMDTGSDLHPRACRRMRIRLAPRHGRRGRHRPWAGRLRVRRPARGA